ncbi:MAG: Pregnancy-associated plasma protein-A, partial [Bacteroidota bacterium]
MAVFSFTVLISANSYSQEKCATHLLPSHSTESVKRFEAWLQKEAKLQRGETEVVQLPVVVHVIHNGEAIGSGTNISFDQISSQIEVLNQDFRRANPNLGDTDPQFEAYAADLEIEFVLARRDPEGLPTDGVVRVRGPQLGYEFADNVLLKEVSYWPSDKYINIWVVQIS